MTVFIDRADLLWKASAPQLDGDDTRETWNAQQLVGLHKKRRG